MYFTIVIPLYNKEKYITRALESIATQSYTNYELIVVDDGSTDSSAKLVEAFADQRIRLIKQKNGGESAARNTGIKAAKYEHIVFLDADDAWKPNHLAVVKKLIKDYPNAGIYGTGYGFVEVGGQVVKPRLFNVPQRGRVNRYFRSVASGDQVITASSVCIPARVFQQLGCFSVGDALGADQDMWARIALHHDVVVDLKGTAIYFRDADNRVCVSEKHVSELPYSQRLQSYIDGIPSMLSIDTKADIEAYIVRGLLTLVSLNVRGGRNETAKKILHDVRLKKSRRALYWKMLAKLPINMSAWIFAVLSFFRTTFREHISR